MTHPLCTQLPDLPAAGTAERHFFANALGGNWCHDDDVPDLHAEFQAAGLPYTHQFQPALPEPEPEYSWTDLDFGYSAEGRNASLFR